MISSRGRYALRVIIDLAENRNGKYIPLKDIANRQEISLKYLERILPVLSKNNMIEGVHGKGGGYKLTKEPDEYKVIDILLLTEGDLAPVACLKAGTSPCERAAECRTLTMWKNYYKLINDYFSGITIADLMKADPADNYII